MVNLRVLLFATVVYAIVFGLFWWALGSPEPSSRDKYPTECTSEECA